MAEENTTLNPADTADVLPKTMEFMNTTMETFLSAASVDAVFARPVKAGDSIIISAAETLSVMGFGVGGGSGTGPSGADCCDEKDDKNEEAAESKQAMVAGGSGIGGGGGGRVLSRPVAVVIASPEGVRVEPVVDVTKIGLAMFTALGFMVGMLARMRRPGRND